MLKKKRGRPKGSTIKKQSNSLVKEIYYTKSYEDIINTNEKIIILRGGAGSGKSWGIIQYLMECMFTYDGIYILIARKNFTSLRDSTIRDFWTIVDMYGLRHYFHEDKQAGTITTGKSYLKFASLLDIERIKSSAYNIIFVEEANSIKWTDFGVLQTRLRRTIESEWGQFRNRIILALNPVSSFNWIKTRLIDRRIPDLKEFVSTYRDNGFLTDDFITDLENLKYQDKVLWDIYANGMWGELSGLIFTNNWKQVKHVDKENYEPNTYLGIDFGWSNPSCVIRVDIDGKDVYVEEKLYQTHLTINDLIEKLKEIIPEKSRGRVMLICDSEAPDQIEELRRAGFWTRAAYKGPGSVLDGIKFMQSCSINVNENSTNIINEFSTYIWKQNKDGNSTDEPVKANDHSLSAIRYVLYTMHKAQSNKVLVGGIDNTPSRNNDMWR